MQLRVYKDGPSISHGEKIRFKMRLGCVRVVLQALTGEKTIIDSFGGV